MINDLFDLTDGQNNIMSESRVSELLSDFDTDYVYSIIDDVVNDRMMGQITLNNPNIPKVFYTKFLLLLEQAPEHRRTEIDMIARTTFYEISKRLCINSGMDFSDPNDFLNENMYSMANMAEHLYMLLAGNFRECMEMFFMTYINTNMQQIYSYSPYILENKAKIKQTVAKNIPEGSEIFIQKSIIMFLPQIINDILSMDMHFEHMISALFMPEIVTKLMQYVSIIDNPYNLYREAIRQSPLGPYVITDLKMKLSQQFNLTKYPVTQDELLQYNLIKPEEDE